MVPLLGLAHLDAHLFSPPHVDTASGRGWGRRWLMIVASKPQTCSVGEKEQLSASSVPRLYFTILFK